MNSKKRSVVVLVALSIALVSISIGCLKHQASLFVGPCDPAKTYFTKDILPILRSNCGMSGCHSGKSGAEDYDFTNYYGTMQAVNAGDASNSKLIEVMGKTGRNRMPPSGYPAMSTAQIQLISKWINEGALNELCNSTAVTCDTTNATFSAVVTPILQNNCTGCHNSTNSQGGIDLSTYAGVAAQASNGKLLGSIKFEPGFSPMPKSGSQLSSCDRAKIAQWVANHFPNN